MARLIVLKNEFLQFPFVCDSSEDPQPVPEYPGTFNPRGNPENAFSHEPNSTVPADTSKAG
jgi:hypothetical protein